MSVYALLKFVHVLAAIVAVGTNITYGVWMARAGTDRTHLGFVLRAIKVLDDRLANPAYGLLLITGLAMLYVGGIPWTTPWVLSGLALYALVVIVGVLGFSPALRAQIAAVEREQAAPAYAATARSRTLGIVATVLVVLIVFVMVVKPSLWG